MVGAGMPLLRSRGLWPLRFKMRLDVRGRGPCFATISCARFRLASTELGRLRPPSRFSLRFTVCSTHSREIGMLLDNPHDCWKTLSSARQITLLSSSLSDARSVTLASLRHRISERSMAQRDSLIAFRNSGDLDLLIPLSAAHETLDFTSLTRSNATSHSLLAEED